MSFSVAGAPQVVEYLLVDVLLYFGIAAGEGNADAVQEALVLRKLGYELVVGHGRGLLMLYRLSVTTRVSLP